MRLQVQDWLTAWFVAKGKIGKSSSETLRSSLCDTDYFEAGWLTSMEAVEFVTEIERHFEMQFSELDLQDPRFVTIAGLTELILERSTPVGGSR